MYRAAPASKVEIEQLVSASPIKLPDEYLALLQLTNGGEADLGLPPLLFCPYEITYLLELFHEQSIDEMLNSFFIIGSNGGLETIAFDLRQPAPYPVVMIDLIGGEETSIEIAAHITDLLTALGHPYPNGEL